MSEKPSDRASSSSDENEDGRQSPELSEAETESSFEGSDISDDDYYAAAAACDPTTDRVSNLEDECLELQSLLQKREAELRYRRAELLNEPPQPEGVVVLDMHSAGIKKEITRCRDKLQLLRELQKRETELKKQSEQYRCKRNMMAYASRSEECPVCLKMVNVCVDCNLPEADHQSQEHQYKKRRIVESHPYSRAVLKTFLGHDYFGIWDFVLERRLKPSTCKWRHLCVACDTATATVEAEFVATFRKMVENPTFSYSPNSSATSDTEILVDHADLFYVYTFRALQRNVHISHYVNAQQCSCNQLMYSLHNFLMRARHLSHPRCWEGRKRSGKTYISPWEAGMLFHIERDLSANTSEHFIEFPVICRVSITGIEKEFVLIFAQIPPFYWAFPLPLEQSGQHDISEDLKTSPRLVKAHCDVVEAEALELVDHFPRIIDKVNKELKNIRVQNVTPLQKDWSKKLAKEREEAERNLCKIEEQGKLLETRDELLSEENQKKLDDIKKSIVSFTDYRPKLIIGSFSAGNSSRCCLRVEV